MPVLEFHLAEGQHPDAAVGALLRAASHRFAEVLQCPVDRVRAFVHLHRATHVAWGSELASEGAAPAPFFHFRLMEGRPLAHAQQLLADFTELAVTHLEVDRARVRGYVSMVSPQLWSIGGVPASQLRAAEIAARARPAVPREPGGA